MTSDLLEGPHYLKADTLYLFDERLLLLESKQLVEIAASVLALGLQIGIGNHQKSGRATVHHQVPGMRHGKMEFITFQPITALKILFHIIK